MLLHFTRVHRVIIKYDLTLMIVANTGGNVEGNVKALLWSLIKVAKALLAVRLAEYILIF